MLSIHMETPTDEGRHPQHPHLVMFEVEPHYGSLLLRTPAVPGGSALISAENWEHAVGDKDQADMEFAYLVDDYLDLMQV